MHVGFVGLGLMGCPIALNLLRKGENLTVCSRSGRGLDAFKARGAAVTRCCADLAVPGDGGGRQDLVAGASLSARPWR